ncbi:phosphate/phosphite/phosphonate ABC transporter substrate-binding protein [Amycolatopsis acidicola]|uniref:Phosphate/phosphite/phosphonate ABC transporter substrate-binding protein n=1 Tax=Amycolatopsis acidicola TaxID=2596893 RepID=A0A5N0V2T7_9PSEU|nr:PhnD/SsuA/transferrin family substrate-binding protein [Amycolatopsis acidicola]KAA9157786.1 phosphate/phosphite/phosphonate ABC transporter substrate-binding protein [Amycolatopsis acidicola]
MSELVLGAVAYDPKVVTIWEGFRRWLRERGCEFDFVLYSNYERLAEELVAGRMDVAWNSPLAWVRSRRLAAAAGKEVRAVAMRDTDRDLTTAIVVRADSGIETLAGVSTIATGAVDSPQATLLPLSLLRSAGVEAKVRRFDVGVGLHGDHIGGERDAMIALRDGLVDAACVSDTNLLLFSQEGTIAAGSTRVLAHTEPYDHCVLTTAPGADADQLTELLLGMSYSDPVARPLLDLEGLTRWLPGRTSLHAGLEKAVDEAGFYDAQGNIRARDYRP